MVSVGTVTMGIVSTTTAAAMVIVGTVTMGIVSTITAPQW